MISKTSSSFDGTYRIRMPITMHWHHSLKAWSPLSSRCAISRVRTIPPSEARISSSATTQFATTRLSGSFSIAYSVSGMLHSWITVADV